MMGKVGTVEVESQGHLLKTHVPGASGGPAHGGGVRGVVRGFSRASRKRLLEKFARLDVDTRPCFIDLTYPTGGSDFRVQPYDGGELPTPAAVRRHKTAFVKRLQRRFPCSSGYWRFETASSGQRSYNPHLHLVMFGVPFVPVEVVRRLWCEVIGAQWCRVGISSPKRWRGKMWYLSKRIAYVAKNDPGQEIESFGETVGVDGDGLLVIDAYHAADDESEPSPDAWTGRIWGYWGKRHLPFAALVHLVGELGSWFYHLKRGARHIWPGVNRKRYNGFTLFRPDPLEWVRAALHYGGELRPVDGTV